ncbi:hypothetical protein RHGRI_016146 [Rhododendron griersonianum]|uniref:Inositol-pentakisphosphate 2-kinase n=1 Tax=Rhododendron griersonianum TaxID=479676 RepID=A0AAV6JSS4_9ERIC|nr:hypothetical protein RHGRI_016146 [Rhododendron griersonianum]
MRAIGFTEEKELLILFLTSDKCRQWEETQDAQHAITPISGPGQVDTGISVHVSRDFLESVEMNVLCQSPSWGVDAANPNTICNVALLISDHPVFPRGILEQEVCISVET